MGAKQSKRSVDISGKEAESAGEVAAAGAGGEGRVEQLADADALKPQLNGDAHIAEPEEKEKQLDNGTPENEKDATTEKENKEQEDEKEPVAVTNGESESKPENGETPSPEENKKPKKEKVKKKWSLRSISFSRKDKPKQEKKQKDEDKTNGEPEKLPEEVLETTAETEKNEVVQEENTTTDVKEDKTPETPVTEPITNGSSTPETPKVETPVEETVELKTEVANLEPKVEPEQLPVNGLSLEEPQNNDSESIKIESSKPEEITVESIVPATEIPVQKEVCVDQMPLIEPTPPPLPATPPPSSVASFAATTMAPELTDASLSNTAHIITDSTAVLDTNTDIAVKDLTNEVQQINIQPKDEVITEPATANEVLVEEIRSPVDESNKDVEPESCLQNGTGASATLLNEPEEFNSHIEIENKKHDNPIESEVEKPSATADDDIVEEDKLPLPPDNQIDVKEVEVPAEDIKHNECIANEAPTSVNTEVNGSEIDDTEIENLKNKSKDSQTKLIKTTECNGDVKPETIVMNGDSVIDDDVKSPKPLASPEDSMPPSLSETMESLPPQGGDVASNDASDSFPLPPSELCPFESEISQPGTPERNGEAPTNPTQEPLIASDKMADLIPEVPVIPELDTESVTATDVQVAD